jgi:dolichol-phosphate mannosyltransferase
VSLTTAREIGSRTNTAPTLSVVAPVYNEQACIRAFISELCCELDKSRFSYEVICADDGSTDLTKLTACALRAEFPALRIVGHARNRGQSAAIAAGIAFARGEVIALIDSDLQNDPADIVRLLPKILDGEATWDCVVGVRIDRRDNWLRRISSRLANWAAARITRLRYRDSACGLRLCRASVLKRIRLFRGAHRFLAQLIAIEGGRVVEVEVGHRARYAGQSKYGTGLARTFVALRDAFAIRWMADSSVRVDAQEIR